MVCERFVKAEAMLLRSEERASGHPWTAINIQAARSIQSAICENQTGAASRNTVMAIRGSLIENSKQWCSQVLSIVQPKPRDKNSIPRVSALLDGHAGHAVVVKSRSVAMNCSRSVLHPRDKFYAAMGDNLGVPPTQQHRCGA